MGIALSTDDTLDLENAFMQCFELWAHKRFNLPDNFSGDFGAAYFASEDDQKRFQLYFQYLDQFETEIVERGAKAVLKELRGYRTRRQKRRAPYKSS